MNRRARMISLATTVVLVALNLVALNTLLSGWSTARVDLTEEGVYSISPATKRLLTNLDENLTVHGYFSKRTHPKLAPLVPELEDLLAEYRAVSRGKVHVEIVDPGENDEIEQEAADRYGVKSTPFRLASKYESAIVNAFFAVVVKYGDQYVRYGFEDLIQVEPSADGDIDVRLRNPEYDLTRAIKKVVYGFRATSELFERTDRPVVLRGIWTPKTLPEMFSKTPDAVRKAVEELKAAGGGDKLTLEEIEPSGDPAQREQLYTRFGARPMSLGMFDDSEFYLYAILDVGGQLEQLPLTGEEVTAATMREAIENSLRRHTPGFLKTVGIVTSGGPQIPPELRMQMNLPPEPPPEFQEVKQVLGEDYAVEDVSLGGFAGVPTSVDVLLVLKPKDLTEEQVYQLDQYLMRGGRIVLCAANFDVRFDPSGLSLSPMKTGLEDWLAHFGVTAKETLVLDDRNQPLPIPQMRSTPFGTMHTWALAPYPYLVQVREEGFRNPEITAALDSVGIYWGSPLTIDKEAAGSLQVIPILQSSDRSWTSEDLSAVSYVDYTVPTEGTGPQLLAVALTGRFKSYFAEKGAPGAGSAASPGEGGAPPSTSVTLKESPETRLVVVGNAEFLSDFVARALARVDGGFFIENLRFAQNLIDWSSLDNDMLGIRSRGLASRRLDRTSRGEQTLTEWINYAAPVVLLGFVGAFFHWKRRQTRSLASAVSPALPVTPASTTEVGR